MTSLRFSTRAILDPHFRVGRSNPIAPPIYQTASFEFNSAGDLAAAIEEPGDDFIYSRLGNPTVTALERVLGDLEGGEAIAFASGMAAIYCALMDTVSAGDHVVAPSSLYGGTFQLLNRILPRFGVEATFVNGHEIDAWRAAIRPNTKVVFAETIVNPTLEVVDLAALAALSRQAGAKLVVDSTLATPYLCRPLELGADIVVHSASKYLGGHGDLLAGALAAPATAMASLRTTAHDIGGIAAPFVAWLTLRGLKTLPLRMEQHSSSALRVARWLEEQPGVARVRYPGLVRHPQHALARQQLGGRFGGVLAFELADEASAPRLIDALRVFKLAPSLGDVHSLIIQPAGTSHRQLAADELARAGISRGLIRASIGLEDPDDLIADLERGLAR